VVNDLSSSHDETIVAIASASGGGARGIVRAGGGSVLDCIRRCFTPADGAAWPPTHPTAIEGELRLRGFSSVPCTALVWPGSQSYTRAPTVELHMPGSPPLLDAAAAGLCEAGARPARPGEFTMRAFLAGRIDLVEAEGVLGIVEADDRRRLDEALRQMAGGLARSLGRLRDQLIDLAAHLEAGLDFVDEDIEFIGREELIAGIDRVAADVGRLSAQMQTRSESADFVRVVLLGRPNAGKSSLFNALVGAEQAIVSPTVGTTRDYLSARVAFDGVPCELIDTAGVEESATIGQIRATTAPESIDEAARRTTAGRAAAAHVRVLCYESSEIPADGGNPADPMSLVVRTKADLKTREAAGRSWGAPAVSVVTGEGIAELRRQIGERAGEIFSGGGDVVASTAVRCRDSLRRAEAALAEARDQAAVRRDELVSASLRAALDELGQVVGVVYTDDILDRVFSRFCIGK
jgi:tRNA modification GTPase